MATQSTRNSEQTGGDRGAEAACVWLGC